MKVLKNSLCFFLLVLSLSAHAQNWDIRLLDKLNSAPKPQDKTWQFISNSSVEIDLALPIGLYIAGSIKHDATIKNYGLSMGVSFLANEAFTISCVSRSKIASTAVSLWLPTSCSLPA